MSESGSRKIISIGDISAIPPHGEDFALCFGHFDVIHPGHLRYFRQALNHGTKLAVAVAGDQQFPEIEQGEHFSQEERASSVAALDVVDVVLLLDSVTLEDLVTRFQPRSLVLGSEFQVVRAEEVSSAVAAIQALGREVIYAAGETHYASTSLLHGSQDVLEAKRWREFEALLSNSGRSIDQLYRKFIDSDTPRILVIGDTIVDRYVACDPVGLSNEAPVVVVREIEEKQFIGGAAIIAAHVRGLRAQCSYLSVTGVDEEATFVSESLAEAGVTVTLFEDSSRPTTLKTRYLVEHQKLFRVSRLKEHRLASELEDKVIQEIRATAPQIDGIIVSDFVYGVITPKILTAILEIAKKFNIKLFGDLQCSSQIGNVAKFVDFELICPTEKEARIALNNSDDGIEYVANMLIEKTRSEKLIVTLGGDGLIAYAKKHDSEFLDRDYYPPLTVNPVDVAGAGDALLAGTTTSLLKGFNLKEAAAIGSCLAAVAVGTIGNVPISVRALEKFVRQKHMEYKRQMQNGR